MRVRRISRQGHADNRRSAHLHSKLGSVYAFRSELDTWLQSRGHGQDEPEPSTHRIIGRSEPAAKGTLAYGRLVDLSPRGWASGIAACLGVFVAGLLVSGRWVGSTEKPPGSAALLPVARDGATGHPRHVDPVARQQYLVGRYDLWRCDEENLKRAIHHFDRATQVDPTDAAFAALSNAWWARGMFGDRDEPGVPYFPVDPQFLGLHALPQWRELVRRTGFSSERRQ